MKSIEKLKSIELFDENEYFYKYVNLIEENLHTTPERFKTEKHHIIPLCYYKLMFNCKDRKEAEIFSKQDYNEIIHLSYRNHLLAHVYLCLCAKPQTKLKYALSYAVRNVTSKLKNKAKIHDIIKSENLLVEYQSIKELQSKGHSARMRGNKHGKNRIKSEEELEDIRKRNSGGRYMNNGTQTKHIHGDKIDEYLNAGWVFGSIQKHTKTLKGTITINNGDCEKRIDEKDLNTYLDKGWTKGKIKGYKQVKRKYRPQIAVFNSKSNVEKHIPKNTINEFLVENPLFITGSKPRKKYKTRQNQK